MNRKEKKWNNWRNLVVLVLAVSLFATFAISGLAQQRQSTVFINTNNLMFTNGNTASLSAFASIPGENGFLGGLAIYPTGPVKISNICAAAFTSGVISQNMALLSGRYPSGPCLTRGLTGTFTLVGSTSGSISLLNANNVVIASGSGIVRLTNPPTLSISGYKINARTGVGIPNWIIALETATGVPIFNTTTDSKGFYQFNNISNGQYIVLEGSQAGWITVSQPQQNVTVAGSDVTDINFTNAPHTPVAYVTHDNGSDNVSVINTSTKAVTATVNVGTDPLGVAVSPDGTMAYVANAGSSSVSVINTTTNTVTATVNVGNFPNGVAVSPDGSNVYVTNGGSYTVSVINRATNTVTATVNVGASPGGVAVTPDGTKVYVANGFSNTVSVINASTNTVTDTVNVGNFPAGVTVSPDGKTVYVTNAGGSTVSVINTATDTVTTTVSVGLGPAGVAVTPDGTNVYVGNAGSNTVSVINTATNTVTATVNVGNEPAGVAITPDGTEVYVTNGRNNTVSVIDTATNTVTATVSVGSEPFGADGIAIS